jgi:hypothetical protein
VLYGGASDVAAQARAFASAGVEELVVSIGSLELMDWFAEDVLPEIAG